MNFPLICIVFDYSIDVSNQLIDHGWCSRISTRLTSFDPDDFDYVDKTITAMISLINVCRKDFVSLISTLEKFHNIYTKTDLFSTDILDNIQILLNKLQQRSSDDL